MARAAEKNRQLTPGAAILRLRDEPFDSRSLAILLPGFVRTLDEVAEAFGMSPNTVKQSWKSAGMPGKSGRYQLAKIAEWRLKHLASLEDSPPLPGQDTEKELRRRLKEAEVEKVEIDVESRRIKLEQSRGTLIDRDSVIMAHNIQAKALREYFLTSPEDFAPELPPDQAVDIIERWRAKLERGLKRFSEQSARDVMKGAS